MCTQISGRMPASSQASSELSTASFTLVSSALRGESKPSRWRFLAKNSLTEMSRWPAASVWAVARRLAGGLAAVAVGLAVLSATAALSADAGAAAASFGGFAGVFFGGFADLAMACAGSETVIGRAAVGKRG